MTTLESGLLAEGAALAERPAGPCALCPYPIVAWQRYAALVPSGRLAHVRCVAATGRR